MISFHQPGSTPESAPDWSKQCLQLSCGVENTSPWADILEMQRQCLALSVLPAMNAISPIKFQACFFVWQRTLVLSLLVTNLFPLLYLQVVLVGFALTEI